MFPLPRPDHIFNSTGCYNARKLALRTLAASKRARSAIAALLTLCTIVAFLLTANFGRAQEQIAQLDVDSNSAENFQQKNATGHGRFHLLVPATSTNPDLCKLLTSAQILDYPTPVLINFGDVENADGYVQHLAKVQGFLDYLESVVHDRDSNGQDLVLIVDGYDVWFQLRRDVLLKRYYALNEAADARNREKYGNAVFAEHDMRQTVVFGPDKICWPMDFSRPACWAVPRPTTMANYAMGPETALGRYEQNEPRWLNSGTIMGPAEDLLDMFRATMEEIRKNPVVNSDQFFMAEIFGRQEYARLQTSPDLMAYYSGLRYGDERINVADNITRHHPDLTSFERTEYHIGIDYESSLFQTLAFWKQYLTWTRSADSGARTTEHSHDTLHHPHHPIPPQYQMQLPDDTTSSDPPFSALSPPSNQSWADVELLYNTITRTFPVSLHFTGPKEFRQYWWSRLWFQETAGELRPAALRRAAEFRRRQRHGIEEETEEVIIGGYAWRNAETPEAQDVQLGGLGGAWSDYGGGWYSWRGLCHEFEEELYDGPGDWFRHPGAS